MASITANTQISKHSLIGLRLTIIWVVSYFVSPILFAQDTYTPHPKAQKLFDKAEESIRLRDFPNGIDLYHSAIAKDSAFTKAYLRLALSYEILRKMDTAYYFYDQYRLRQGIDQMSASMGLKLVEIYLGKGYYQLADSLIKRIKISDQESDRYEKIKTQLDFIIPRLEEKRTFTITELSDSVNRFYSQYFPALTVDGNTMIYTSRQGLNYIDDEDLVVSRLIDNEWSGAVSISDRINSTYNEGAATISADGRTLIFTSCEEELTIGSCDLFIAKKTGEVWSKPRNLGNVVNSIYWDSQPSLSADGRILYFSSNRPGGQGNRDIWISYYNEGQWRKPFNAGKLVNTGKDEVTPYIHANNASLFFGSQGHPGFGGYDLYQSIVEDSIPGVPQNLGFGINDHLDQVSIALLPDGQTGYYAKDVINQAGEKVSRIVRVDFNQGAIVEQSASFVTGKVFDRLTGAVLSATIELNDLNNSATSYSTASDPVSGTFYFVLPHGQSYGVWVEKEGYLFEDLAFDVSSVDVTQPDTLDIYLQPIAIGAQLTLENIYFEFDSYKLSKESIGELNAIVKYLQNNPVVIEISGHTDQVGSESYNLELSEKRAEAVYKYLISNGISANYLSFKGYGSQYPLSENITEEFKNRRIDFKIVDKVLKK